MRHRKGHRKLSRTSSHRLAMLRNMSASLLEHEEIKTTLPKAKELRSYVEKIITLGKRSLVSEGSKLANRRKALGKVNSQEMVRKVFDDLALRYKERKGGYTRIVKAGYRTGDNAPMAIIQLVGKEGKE